MDSWLKTTTSLWKDLGVAPVAPDRESSSQSFTNSTQEEPEDDSYRAYQMWETAIKNMASLTRILSSPENQETLSKSSSAFFEATTQASADSLENIAEFHAKMVEGLDKIVDHTGVYNFDDLDHDSFESFRNLYRCEIRKYLQMPKVGLPRQYQEQLSQLIDRSYIYYSHLSELLFLFSLPFEKTNRRMQKKTSQMLESGEFIDSSKQLYKVWIQQLETNFTNLLNSQEYTSVLNNTIASLADYKNSKNDIIAFLLKDLQVPTNKEMDEVYKDLYTTKKKLNKLTVETTSLKREISDLKTDMGILMEAMAQSQQQQEKQTP